MSLNDEIITTIQITDPKRIDKINKDYVQGIFNHFYMFLIHIIIYVKFVMPIQINLTELQSEESDIFKLFFLFLMVAFQILYLYIFSIFPFFSVFSGFKLKKILKEYGFLNVKNKKIKLKDKIRFGVFQKENKDYLIVGYGFKKDEFYISLKEVL